MMECFAYLQRVISSGCFRSCSMAKDFFTSSPKQFQKSVIKLSSFLFDSRNRLDQVEFFQVLRVLLNLYSKAGVTVSLSQNACQTTLQLLTSTPKENIDPIRTGDSILQRRLQQMSSKHKVQQRRTREMMFQLEQQIKKRKQVICILNQQIKYLKNDKIGSPSLSVDGIKNISIVSSRNLSSVRETPNFKDQEIVQKIQNVSISEFMPARKKQNKSRLTNVLLMVAVGLLGWLLLQTSYFI